MSPHQLALESILAANLESGTKPAAILRVLRAYIAANAVNATAALVDGVITLTFF